MLLVSVNHYLQQAQAVATGWPAGPLLGPSVRCPVFTYPHHAMLTSDQALTFRSHTLHTASNSQGRGPRREGATSMQNIFLRCISFLTTSNLS